MAIQITTEVYCDTDGCGEHTGEYDAAVFSKHRGMQTEARVKAFAVGWTNRGGRDLCPNCSEVPDQEDDEEEEG